MEDLQALEILRLRVKGSRRQGEFETLEGRWRENQRDERINGQTDTLRYERNKIRAALNVLALEVLGFSFNDMLYDRVSATILRGQDTVREVAVELGLEMPMPLGRPPVVSRLQELPFDELTWENFELLCAALIKSLPDVRTAHLYGVKGDFQKGIDIVATHVREGWEEIGVYQCKKRKEFSAADVRAALDRIIHPADFRVVVLSGKAGARSRDEIDNKTSFLWDAADLSRALKLFPELVEDFFGVAWRRAFHV